MIISFFAFFAFFEEIGWRGYTLPKLEIGYPRLAPALVGFLHGVWHLPLMLLTTAYNPAGNRLIVVPLFLAVLTVAGILYGYPRNACGSLWPVVIAHGRFNAVLGVLAGAAIVVSPTNAAYLTGETGVFTLLALMIVSWILTRRSAVARCTGSLTPPSNCCAGACGCSMQSWHAAQPTRESGRLAPHSRSGPVLAALRSGPHGQRAMPGLHPSEPCPAAQLAARGLSRGRRETRHWLRSPQTCRHRSWPTCSGCASKPQ